MFGNEAEMYISAGGHNGNQNKDLVKHMAEDLGFEYMSASTKEEFISCSNTFVSPEPSAKPLLLEIFVTVEDELQGNDILAPDNNSPQKKGIKSAVKKLLGEQMVANLKSLMGDSSHKGAMGVDVGHN